jgi:predicted extracellular nuclease
MGSAPIELITSAGLLNLMAAVPPEARYTYIFDGVSQVLDHVFISQSLAGDPLAMLAARPQPFAADYPAFWEGVSSTYLRASDHDPILAVLLHFDQIIHIPIIGSPK